MHMKKWVFLRLTAALVAAVLLLGAAPVPAQAESSSEIQERIDALQEQYDRMEEEKSSLSGLISDNMDQMERLVAEKSALEQQIFILHAQLHNVQEQILAYNLLIADKQEELDAAQERLDELTVQNQQRIRAMEMYGEMSYWSVLAQAGSFGELLDRLSMVYEIAQADKRRLAQLHEAAQAVEQARDTLEKEKASLEGVYALLLQTQEELDGKKAQSDALLQQLYAMGQEYEEYLARKEEEQAQLAQQLAQAEMELTEAKKEEYQQWLSTSVPPSTQSSPGQNDPPSHVVNGITWTMPIRYTFFSSAYGWRESHPLYGDRRFHHGVDLAAPEGTDIVAARSGVVTVAQRSDSAGYYVTINHGDGFSTTYMHMTHFIVSVGQRVTAGQKIGECGNTGASKGNHLHFGVYYNGKSVNPANYINFY